MKNKPKMIKYCSRCNMQVNVSFQKGRVESDSRAELINSSYSKGTSVPRVEKIGNKFQVFYYQVYSPTTIGSINGLFGATEGRAITQVHTRSLNNDSRGEMEIDEKNFQWGYLRDNLYLFGLKYWKQIEEIYQNKEIWNSIGLKKRDLQLWKPILSIAKLIGEDWFEEILNFANEYSNIKLDEQLNESSFDYFCLNSLKKIILNFPLNEKHYMDLIKEEFLKNNSSESRDNIYLNRNISIHLKKIGFSINRDSKASFVIANRNIFDEIVSPICPQLAFSSTLSTLSTLSIQYKGKEEKSSVDNMVIGVDNENLDKKNNVDMVINGDNVDTCEMKGGDYDF